MLICILRAELLQILMRHLACHSLKPLFKVVYRVAFLMHAKKAAGTNRQGHMPHAVFYPLTPQIYRAANVQREPRGAADPVSGGTKGAA